MAILRREICLNGTRTESLSRKYVQGGVKDEAGNSNLPIAALQFTRVQEPLLVGTSYRILKPPGLQSIL